MNYTENFYKLSKFIRVKVVMLLILLSFSIVACDSKDNYSSEEFQSMLQGFYRATYISADIDLMKEPLIDEYEFYFEQAMTMAEMDMNFYKSYSKAANDIFGEEFTVDIDITSCVKADKVTKKEVSDKFENIEYVVIVEYDIIFKGKAEEKLYSNKLVFAKIENKWGMTTHLNLPIGRNVYAY